MMKTQSSDIERNKPIKDSKRMTIDKIVKERINNNLKFQV